MEPPCIGSQICTPVSTVLVDQDGNYCWDVQSVKPYSSRKATVSEEDKSYRGLLRLMMTLPFLCNHKLLPLEVLTSTNSLLCAKEWCCTVFYTRALCD
ncbi:hypothetical protein ACROYT_G035822 [Oculina patagonica]